MTSASSFNRFYEAWFDQFHHLVHQLRKAPKPPGTEDDSTYLGHLVQKLMFHHAEYFRVKTLAAERDVLSVFTASWASSLERSLHWIAGWRPTTLFHLVYTESSILFEFHIADILRGERTGDLGDLTPTQFRQVALSVQFHDDPLNYFVCNTDPTMCMLGHTDFCDIQKFISMLV